MVKYYYTYEIFVDDFDSKLNGCYYYGKRESSQLDDGYYGSGTLILRYIAKHGVSKLRKTILGIYANRDELNNAEYILIEEKRKELGSKCLNKHEGGYGGHWVEYCTPEEYQSRCRKIKEGVYVHTTSEERSRNAKNAGLARRNASLERRSEWSEHQRQRHASMSKEEKSMIYDQVSNSLVKYYEDTPAEELAERNKKNTETNIKTARAWRAEFFSIFHATPESFRSRRMIGEAFQLFKLFQLNGTDTKQLTEFFNKVQQQPSQVITYTEERNNKLRKYQQEKRQQTAKYVYTIDGHEFYGESQTMTYIAEKYGYKLYKQKFEKIAQEPGKYIDRYPYLLNIERKENLIND